MERLLWLLLLCGVAGGANWYYPQKYEPQVAAAEQRAAEIPALEQERDKAVADAAAKKEEAEKAHADMQEMSNKVRGMQADDEARLQKAQDDAEKALLAAKPQAVVPDMKGASMPMVNPQAPPPQPEKKGLSDFDLKQIADLKADIAAAQDRLKVATDELQKWDAGAYVDESGMLRGARPVHKTSTNAPGEINDARARIQKDEAELIGLQGPGG